MFQDVEVIALEDWDFLFYIAKLFLGSIKKNQKKFSTITSGTEWTIYPNAFKDDLLWTFIYKLQAVTINAKPFTRYLYMICLFQAAAIVPQFCFQHFYLTLLTVVKKTVHLVQPTFLSQINNSLLPLLLSSISEWEKSMNLYLSLLSFVTYRYTTFLTWSSPYLIHVGNQLC